MQIIPENLIVSVSADSEDTEFSANNVLNVHSRKTWKTSDSVLSGVLTLAEISAAANGLELWYLLGDSVTITVYDDVDLGGDIIYGPTETDLIVSDSYYSDVQVPGVWAEYTSPGVAHSAKAEISRTGDEPEIGIAYGGKRWEIGRNPRWGIGKPFVDHSIAYDLDNGYEYLFDRNKQKRWPMTLDLPGNPPTDFHTIIEMLERIGPNPVPVLVADGATPQHRYLMYGRFLDVNPTEAKYNLSTIAFTLKEYL